MDEEQRKTKDRSPNFPFISLAQAVQRAQQFYFEERRGAAPFQVAAKHWGYSPSSSGAFQTAAAMKSYGLMSDEGSGEKRTLRLTDLGLRILLDQRPDSPDKPRLMRQAALMPAIAVEAYQKGIGSLPSKPSLHHFLVLDRGFGDQKAQSVVKILYENDELTRGTDLPIASSSAEIDNESTSEVARKASQMSGAPEIMLSPPTVAAFANVWAKPERIAFGGVELVINWNGVQPNTSVFKFIEDYMELRQRHAEAEKNMAASSSLGGDQDKN